MKKKIIIGLVAFFLFCGLIGVIFDDGETEETEETTQTEETAKEKKKVRKGSEKKTASDPLIGYEYKLKKKKGKIVITDCPNQKVVCIQSSYNIDGVDYQTDLSDFQVGGYNVKKIAFSEGITKLPEAVFNGSEIKTIYFPLTMTKITDNMLSYLDYDSKKPKIFYAGTEEQWNSIFEVYQRQTVSDAMKTKDGEKVGTALADKVNDFFVEDYSDDNYKFYFNATIDEVIN